MLNPTVELLKKVAGICRPDDPAAWVAMMEGRCHVSVSTWAAELLLPLATNKLAEDAIALARAWAPIALTERFRSEIPLLLLALGALGAGLTGSPWLHHPLFHLLGEADVHEGFDLPVLLLSTIAAGAGIWLAWTAGFKRTALLPEGLRPLGGRLYRWASHQYYVDEAYERWLIRPAARLARRLSRFDLRVIDGAVDRAGRVGWTVGAWKERFDRLVVDGFVNGVALTVRGFGAVIRWIQTGVIQQYLFVVVAAVVALSFMLKR